MLNFIQKTQSKKRLILCAFLLLFSNVSFSEVKEYYGTSYFSHSSTPFWASSEKELCAKLKKSHPNIWESQGGQGFYFKYNGECWSSNNHHESSRVPVVRFICQATPPTSFKQAVSFCTACSKRSPQQFSIVVPDNQACDTHCHNGCSVKQSKFMLDGNTSICVSTGDGSKTRSLKVSYTGEYCASGGGSSGGSDGGSSGGSSGGSDGGSSGGSSGGSDGGSSGGSSGGSDGGSSGGSSGGSDGGSSGGSSGGSDGGSSGGSSGGSDGGSSGGSSGGSDGGSSGGASGSGSSGSGEGDAGSSVSGVKCSDAFTCKGDPVLCANLKHQRDLNCLHYKHSQETLAYMTTKEGWLARSISINKNSIQPIFESFNSNIKYMKEFQGSKSEKLSDGLLSKLKLDDTLKQVIPASDCIPFTVDLPDEVTSENLVFTCESAGIAKTYISWFMYLSTLVFLVLTVLVPPRFGGG